MNNNGRWLSILMVGGFALFVFWMIGNMFGHNPDVMRGGSISYSQPAQKPDSTSVPWDYKVEESTVGDLVGGDMTLLPDNQLLPNDNNYATGDKIWVLEYMNAEIAQGAGDHADIRLSAWKPIKSYKSKDDAQKDLDNLKFQVKSEVNVVGVYKTSYQGKTRDFAVVTLPSGNAVKQPIDDARYNTLRDAKKTMVMLEEVHDFSNYDLAFAKFRGWAE